MTVPLPNVSYSQPGRLLAHTADIFGVEVSDMLTGHAPSVRAWAVHQLATHFPDWPEARIAATVCLTSVGHILSRRPPAPPADAVRPPDTGMCTVQGCTRAHRAAGLRMCAGHMARWRRNATLDVDRPLRPVNVNTPVLDVESHDWRAYRQGCRCRPCTDDAVRQVKRNRLRPQARPVAAGLAALERLTDVGMSIPQAAEAAGIGSACLYTWRNGAVQACRQSTIDKLNAVDVTPVDKPCDDGCGRLALAGGRWCRPCMDTRFADPTPFDVRRRRQAARRRRRRQRADTASHDRDAA